ncbi:cupin domain-containing protein [Duganella aceris]|jgi:quercetin dioxygenase-like cupin family protein|uniref:Cupin domain-containing protein n=1 Tax=Duganella aceris TaxID=2703883 RepID=A0ABX0FRA2_9BURK|nr:cupin domain-containing protein [Duganella aceris]NGZ87065.1 cupin domain-containing protein [Duganella aceris]
MKTTRIVTMGALLIAAGFAHPQQQPAAGGIGRTEAMRHDYDDKHDFIQVRVDFGPGAAFPKHTHPGVEVAYVLSGTVEYQLGDQPPVVLKTGDALYIPAGTPHSAKSVGNAAAAELATYIVEKGKPVLVLSK